MMFILGLEQAFTRTGHWLLLILLIIFGATLISSWLSIFFFGISSYVGPSGNRDLYLPMNNCAVSFCYYLGIVHLWEAVLKEWKAAGSSVACLGAFVEVGVQRSL